MKNKLMIVLALASVISCGSIAFAQNNNTGNKNQPTTTRPTAERREERREGRRGEREMRREGKGEEARERRSRRHRRVRRHIIKKSSMNSTKGMPSKS